MDIEVEFEGTRTTFKISENPGAAISPNKDNIKQRVSTFRQSMKTSILNEQPKVPPKTFEDMKGIVAPFFSLSTDEFFFAVRRISKQISLISYRMNGELYF